MMRTVKAGKESSEARMSDKKLDLLEMGKQVAKIVNYETNKAEREERLPSEYIVEMYNPSHFNPKWQVVLTYKDNMFAAIEHGKELSYDSIGSNFRVRHVKNSVSEIIWHS